MSRRPWRTLLVALALACCACGHASGAVLNALLNTGIAAGTSAASRSQGGCYASCPTGTTCNSATGYCDPLPCRGECDPFQECVEDRFTSRCVARRPDMGSIRVNPAPEEQPSTGSKPPGPTP